MLGKELIEIINYCQDTFNKVVIIIIPVMSLPFFLHIFDLKLSQQSEIVISCVVVYFYFCFFIILFKDIVYLFYDKEGNFIRRIELK